MNRLLVKRTPHGAVTFHRRSLTACLQILSTEQWATLVVQVYPYAVNLELLLESLAKKHGEPTMPDLLAAARHNPLTAEWAALDEYVSVITDHYYPNYVPVYRPSFPAMPTVLQGGPDAKTSSLFFLA